YMNGRPSASTPVTTRGTACTIRVLRRFLNSAFGLAPGSEAISMISSAKLLLASFAQTAFFAQCFRLRTNANARRATLRRCFAWYPLRSACGLFPTATSTVLERPRLAQRANKSVPEKMLDGCLRSCVQEATAPIHQRKIPRPKSTSSRKEKRCLQKSWGFRCHATVGSQWIRARDRTAPCSAPGSACSAPPVSRSRLPSRGCADNLHVQGGLYT